MATITASRPVPPESSSQRTADTSQSHPFTCNTCQVAFRNGDLQRTHMRSDWHRYNLKRRVASLPPLSSEIFAEKVLSAQATSSAAAAKAAFERVCHACQKTYYSENAYQNHLGSAKHRLQGLKGKGQDDEASSVMSSTISIGEPIASTTVEPQDPEAAAEFSKVVSGLQDASLDEKEPVSRRPSRPHHSAAEEQRPEHPISPVATKSTDPSKTPTPKPEAASMQRCLFCNYDSPSFKLNVTHMERIHGMFVPEREYLVDLEGLVTYLQAKISQNFECILCHKLKGSAAGVQTHMRDKGHCMIAFGTEAELVEIGQFYDFSSTYSDDEDADAPLDDGGVQLKSNASKDEEMGNAEDADGWETDSSASSLDSADLGALPIDHDHAYERLALHRHHSHSDPRPHRSADGFHSHAHSHHAVFHGDGRDDGDLHLPSGRIAGHRSLARYYRQNLHNHPSPEEYQERRLLTEEGEDVLDRGRRQLATRAARGEMGMVGVSDARKKEVNAVTKRETKKAQRQQRQFDWRVNKQGNNQRHFRDELLGKQGSG